MYQDMKTDSECSDLLVYLDTKVRSSNQQAALVFDSSSISLHCSFEMTRRYLNTPVNFCRVWQTVVSAVQA
jgi:hypothetical protein